MPVTVNLKVQVDLPVWQWLRPLPVISAAGCCQCNDPRGTDRYIYFLFSATSFWRYDTYTDSWQQLPSPVSFTFGAGTAMQFDMSRGTSGYIWLFGPSSNSPYAVWQYYDIAAGTWTSKDATSLSLGSAWGTDASLAHPDTTVNAGAGSDDYIYLIGNNASTFYRYSISGNSWATRTGVTSSAAGGCHIEWVYGLNVDTIWCLRGNGAASIYEYSISGNSWSTITYTPAIETFTTGTSSCYDPVSSPTRMYIQISSSHRFLYFDLTNNVMIPCSTAPYSSGTAMVGNGLSFVKTADGLKFIYYRRQTGTDFYRALVFW
jgi:hypothetical protein